MNDEAKHQMERLFHALDNLSRLLDQGALPDPGDYPGTKADMLRDMAARIERLPRYEEAA